MMENELFKLFQNYQINIKNIKIDNVQWKSQEASASSVLFYKLNSTTPEEVKKLKERLSCAQYAICIIDKKIDVLSNDIFSLSEAEFCSLRESILNMMYPLPRKPKYLGVTGTNGKTTTVDLVRKICITHGKKILSVGTLGVYLGKERIKNFNLTSPAYIDLRKILSLKAQEVDFVAMELSSHALLQNRTGGIIFNQIAWTNLSQDHLDYHKTMEAYLNAKKIVFDIVKADKKIILPLAQKKLGEKINKEDRIKYVSLDFEPKNLSFKMSYNQENLALAINLLSDYFMVEQSKIEQFEGTEGRFNIIPYKDSLVIIDYAHTPDGLSSICREIKKSFPNFYLITIFGCGGDRDEEKRPLMASAAEEFSDEVVLTSDNPRFEKAEKIIEDTRKGFSKLQTIIVDRKKAITETLERTQSKSIILIAGKGHENYIDIKGEKLPYSDQALVMELIND
ncbi:MAG: UDP-N-acetylmuramoyl-L-alanyl-D-glutamate--2,6-diaminopimelate ligase [Halobacteriovoraceae bacterium]|jgi:UDP-N-acetylmuramoyl-L-alanyl-D-glutamate--2,6-diaminopimelate ligase|nr:UDP-N-acetylmuramoyl-L-alanyl-D-glutamate--2,6-diaminopimelate ligase [Halobacteriovoraceae bacterium]